MTRRRVGLIAGPAVLATVLAVPVPAGLSVPGWWAAGVGLLMAIWWITEAIPIPVTALVPLVLFPVLGVASIGVAAAPYANPIIFLFFGGFVIAQALQGCGLHRRLALGTLRLAGTRPANIVGGFMLAAALMSMWVSNTATVVMLYPTALSVIEVAERPPAVAGPRFAPALLFGLAYAANLGGLGTLIGTPPNALLAGFLADTYGREVGFGQWMLLGVPLVAVALPLAWVLLVQVLYPLPKKRIAAGRKTFAVEVAMLGAPSRAEWTVGAITALTAVAWVTRPLLEHFLPGLSDAGISIAGAVALFLVPGEGGVPLLKWEDAERLPWSVLLLFGGGLSLAAAISQTGLADWLGASLGGLHRFSLWAVVGVATLAVLLLTEITSNTATAAAFLPVVGSVAVAMGADPVLLAVPTALAASCAFMLPVATPPNAIVFGSGRLTIPQMARTGVWFNLLMLVLINAAVWVLVRRLFVA